MSSEFSSELLDDFFTECDEHLTQIRQALLLLDPSIGKAQPDSVVIEELFRNFHSFKGISAIVGLRASEELAHATEDYLRELTRGKLTLTDEGSELLMSAAQRLEQIVVAFRSKKPLPPHLSLVKKFQEISHLAATPGGVTDSASNGQNSGTSPIADENARARGLVLWKCTFVPTRELNARGINLNTIRSRFGTVGEILRSTSQVRGQGVVAFEFIVGMRETPADITGWEKDGITAELIEQPATSSAAQPSNTPSGFELTDNPFIAPSHVVRVDLPRLDELMRIVGEMVIQRSRFEEAITQSSRKRQVLDVSILNEVNTGLARSLRELREAIMRVRLVSVAEIFARMPFVVRDLARESPKKVRLILEGQQTEIDKYLIEQLKDPLLHLVRNAFSHGVETPEERRAAGKAEESRIILKASTSGDSVVLSIEDDGRGIDQRAILKRAAEMGLPVPEAPDNSEILKILCSSGFSTREGADRASGRGIGMSVVYNKVRELGGALALETAEPQGTRFVIRLPLTLAIAETLIVSAAGQTCAVPQSTVSEVMQVADSEIRKVNGIEVIPFRSGVLPILRLASIFQLPHSSSGQNCVLVLRSDRGSSGLLVDRIHGQKEVVVRAIRDPLVQVPGITGATELGDGRPVLILDAAALTEGPVRPNLENTHLSSN